MHLVIAGAHGKIALRLIGLLAGSDHRVDGLIRNPEHADEITAAGGRPVVCDLESATVKEVAAVTEHADVVVFAAGSGPGASAERKLSMDRDGAIKLLDAAPGARYLMVSAVGAEKPTAGDEVFSVYLRAKAEADAAVIARGGDYVVIRPGPLSDDRGEGEVRLSLEPFRAEITRDDVASILLALIEDSGLARGQVVYAGGGSQPIVEALRSVT